MKFRVMTSQRPTGAYDTENPLVIYEPKKIIAQLHQAGKDTSELTGFVNSFTYRIRGPISSDGFFLTDRQSMERSFPELFKETDSVNQFSTSTVTFGEKWGHYGNSQATIQIHSSADPTSRYPTRIKDYRGFYVAGAYPITTSLKPEGYQSVFEGEAGPFGSLYSGINRPEDHNFKKQLYIVHLVDERYFLANNNHSLYSPSNITDGPLRLKLPRIWHTASEDIAMNATGSTGHGTMVDTLFQPNKGLEGGALGVNDGYEKLIEHLHPYGPSTSMAPGWDHSLADYPTLCRNIEVYPENRWENLWSLLDEIGHTIVYDYTNGKKFVVALGDDSNTSLASERAANQTKLLKKSYSPSIKIAGDYKVYFPANASTHVHMYVKQISSDSLSIPYTRQEIPAGPSLGGQIGVAQEKTILGRLHKRAYCVDEIDNHAEELAKLHFKKDLFENRVEFRRDIYSGFIDLTETKDISSITWINDGAGPRTILRQDPFHLDYYDFIEVPRIKIKSSFKPKMVPYMPPPEFAHSLHAFQYITGEVPAEDTGIPGQATITDSEYGAVRVWNYQDEAGTGGLVMWVTWPNVTGQNQGTTGQSGRWINITPNVDLMVQDHQVVISSGSSAGTYPVTHP
jgi:hypothetical protein